MKFGFTQNIANVLYDAFQNPALSLTEVRRETYHSLETRSEDAKKDEMKTVEICRAWWLESVRVLTLILDGKAPDGSKRSGEEVQDILKKKEEDLRKWYAEGGTPGVPLVIVTGKKA